ncbi:hypothetical protein D3Z47_17235 [Lachnospiraceae bacterium]|nr:hypothetical protein [Lachnospiraceae bacterium]
MESINDDMPENFCWQEGNACISLEGGKVRKKVSNAVPHVERRTKYNDYGTDNEQNTVTLQYRDSNNISVGKEQEFKESDILNGKFIKERPIEVQIYNMRDGTKVFLEIIQTQIANVPIEMREKFPFGWYEKNFHWLEDQSEGISKEQEYRAAVKIAFILGSGNKVVAALALAAVHGPMQRVLIAAGIQHNFITFLAGATAIGKTALAKKMCGYLRHKDVVWALSSDRKELRKAIQNTSDVTIVIDDFNTSASDRVISRQLQIVSEIIQESCNAGKVMLDEKSMSKRNNCVHTVVTSETIIRNVSTMNRCYLVDMQEKLPDDLWQKISEMDEQHGFAIFVRSFIRYIEENYDMAVSNCREDFSYYKQHAREQMLSDGTSMNRIAETMAVQFTLNNQMTNYMKTVGLDGRLLRRADEVMKDCIICCGQELQQKVNEIAAKKSHMELLPTLAEIISNDGNGYEMAGNENKYKKKIKYMEKCIGFQQNQGYVSFKPSYMCQMIADYLGKEAVSVNCLGKELSYYNLAYVEGSEHKQSCRWHTDGKYYHVNERQLRELIFGDLIDIIDAEGEGEY